MDRVTNVLLCVAADGVVGVGGWSHASTSTNSLLGPSGVYSNRRYLQAHDKGKG